MTPPPYIHHARPRPRRTGPSPLRVLLVAFILGTGAALAVACLGVL